MSNRRPRLARHRFFGVATAVAAVTALTAGAVGATTVEAPDDGTRRLEQSAPDDKVQLVHVLAGTRQERQRLAGLGLDLTEHGDRTGMDLVLHGEEDARILREAGFRWRVEIKDLAAHVRANAAKDRRYAAQVTTSPLPSGRTSYRQLADYNAEMRQLARRFPTMARPITLANRSVEGRPIHGLEITTNVNKVADGKPVMLMVGAHHAREWPSAEHTMEWAYELLTTYKGSARTRDIVRNSRTVIVPVLNVDGFEISRKAAPLGDFSTFDYEMKRKNCSVSRQTPEQYRAGTCADNPAGRLRGTDLNRNYPGFWGGPGASPIWSSDTYRGDAPGSEPEVDALRRLISERQVTNLITNHTYSNLVLRPPSLLSTGFTPDEDAYKALGARMTAHNGYTNQASFQLYDTSGSLEDWSYWNTGGFGFTFEISPDNFHEPYAEAVVAEYAGLAPAAGAGKGGNREAYYQMAEATVDESLHSVIYGRAPRGTTLHLSKHFVTETSPVIKANGAVGEPLAYADHLSSSLRPNGFFEWDVNPSTRPLVAGRWGREPLGPVQPRAEVVNPEGVPAVGQYEEITFSVEGMPTYDNFTAELHVQWENDAVDWDVELYDSEGRFVGDAASLANPEIARLVEPVPGEYTARIINYAGGATSDWTAWVEFTPPPKKVVTGVKESWKLVCTDSRDRVLQQREVVVDRGARVDVGRVCRDPKS